MNGVELKKLLKLNMLTQQEAADLFGIRRETLYRWCKSEEELPLKSQKNITSKLRIKSLDYTEMRGNSVINNGELHDANIDQRQYYSDSPSVLRAQIDLLEEWIKEKDAQIKEKDAQIKEKDAQIHKLLEIISKM